MVDKATIMNVRLPQEIIEWIDDMVSDGLYGNRSEAIREFLRGYIIQNRKDHENVGVQKEES